MHYELRGQGDRVILFIHGFGGFSGLWSWQTEHFAKMFRVLTIDLPGHGRSPWAPCDLTDMARGIVQVLDQEKISHVCVVASSFGALVALTLYQKDPQRVSSLTLTGGMPRFVGVDGFPAGLTKIGISPLAQQFDGDVGKVLDMFVRSFSTMTERESPQYAKVKELRKQALLPQKEALIAFLDILQTADLCDVWRNMQVPTQIINGDGDYICPVKAVKAMRVLQPGVRIDMLKGGGHGVFLTMPDVFNATLEDFLHL